MYGVRHFRLAKFSLYLIESGKQIRKAKNPAEHALSGVFLYN